MGAVNAQLLPAIRDLYSRLPESYHLEPWELQHVLFSLGYTDDLAGEAEIAAAVEAARGELVEKELDAMTERGAHRGEALLR